jgi:hypothetical protein
VQGHLELVGAPQRDCAVAEVLLRLRVANLDLDRLFIRSLRVSTEAGTISSPVSLGCGALVEISTVLVYSL